MKRILVVDDNSKNIRLLTGMLTFQGFEVESALGGAEGVEQALSSYPDLILMDIQMPGLSGTKAMQTLREDPRLRATPIVAVTALAMTGDEEQLLQAGFNGYLSKPVSLNSLRDTISRFLEPDVHGAG